MSDTNSSWNEWYWIKIVSEIQLLEQFFFSHLVLDLLILFDFPFHWAVKVNCLVLFVCWCTIYFFKIYLIVYLFCSRFSFFHLFLISFTYVPCSSIFASLKNYHFYVMKIAIVILPLVCKLFLVLMILKHISSTEALNILLCDYYGFIFPYLFSSWCYLHLRAVS